MHLPTYIKQIGDAAAANLFSVKERTVASWRRGERKPNTAKASDIIRVTGNVVNFEGIYGDTESRTSERRAKAGSAEDRRKSP